MDRRAQADRAAHGVPKSPPGAATRSRTFSRPGLSPDDPMGPRCSLLDEWPLTAQPRHCWTLWGRSLHNAICRHSLSCVADRRFEPAPVLGGVSHRQEPVARGERRATRSGTQGCHQIAPEIRPALIQDLVDGDETGSQGCGEPRQSCPVCRRSPQWRTGCYRD